jgi:hypothetical protein
MSRDLIALVAKVLLMTEETWHGVQTCYGANQHSIQWVFRKFPPEVKRPGREADHLPPSNVEFKNLWSYTFTRSYAFISSRGQIHISFGLNLKFWKTPCPVQKYIGDNYSM